MSHGDVRELIRSNDDFKATLESLYKAVYKTSLNTQCPDCWADAYIILMSQDINKLNAMAERKFELRAGALLIDVVNGDPSKTCSRANITDELALYHLRTNPDYITLFYQYPDNWQELAIKSDPTVAAELARQSKEAEKRASNSVDTSAVKSTTKRSKTAAKAK